jgi:cell wall-associated NlpC family hydrolase
MRSTLQADVRVSHQHVEPRPGDLLLFYGGHRLGWWIECATRSPFYHVALYDDAGYVVDAAPRGVVRRRVDDGTTGTRYIVAPAPEGRGEAALAWTKEQIGRPFDALGMLVVLGHLALGRTPLPITHFVGTRPRRRFTCSHLVAQAFRQAGVELAPGREPAMVAPGDFACLAAAEDVAHAWRKDSPGFEAHGARKDRRGGARTSRVECSKVGRQERRYLMPALPTPEHRRRP